MSQIIQVKEKEIESSGYTPNQIDLIKKQIAHNATDDELKLFLYHCSKTGLDPLSKQIYFQKRGGKAVFMTSIDGYRLIASRTGQHAGTDDAVFDNENEPNKATVTVYRMVQGQRVPFAASARWNEYCPPSPSDSMWRKMPCTMLSKCAEALALRKAFPNELGGMYTAEEMEQSAHAEQPQQIQYPQSDRPATDKQKAMIFAKLKNDLSMASVEDQKAFVASTVGKTSSKDLTMNDIQALLAAIDSLKNATIEAPEIKQQDSDQGPVWEDVK